MWYDFISVATYCTVFIIVHCLGSEYFHSKFLFLCAGEFQLNFDFWRRLDKRLGPHLGQLASDIAEHYAKRTTAHVYVLKLTPQWHDYIHSIVVSRQYCCIFTPLLYNCNSLIMMKIVHLYSYAFARRCPSNHQCPCKIEGLRTA